MSDMSPPALHITSYLQTYWLWQHYNRQHHSNLAKLKDPCAQLFDSCTNIRSDSEDYLDH